MAFETTNKSDNTGGKLRLDISNINQSALKGENANTDEELLQIIIDNIAMKSTPVNSEVSQTLDVNKAVFRISEAFKYYASTQNNEASLPDLIDILTKGISKLDTDLAVQKKVAEGLQGKLDEIRRKPAGDKNPELYSSGTVEQNKLHPVEYVVRATEKQFVETKKIIGETKDIALAIASQPEDFNRPVSRYRGAPQAAPKTLSDSVKNVWIAIEDIRETLRTLMDDVSNRLDITRMDSIKTFYVFGDDACSLIASARTSNAMTSARDIWNETGLQMDPTCPAYSSNVPSAATELRNGTWYCSVGENGNVIGQYSNFAPFWLNVGTSCPAGETSYTTSDDLDSLSDG